MDESGRGVDVDSFVSIGLFPYLKNKFLNVREMTFNLIVYVMLNVASLVFKKRCDKERTFFDTRLETFFAAHFKGLKEILYILDFAVRIVLHIRASSFLGIPGSIRLSSNLLCCRPRLRQRTVNQF